MTATSPNAHGRKDIGDLAAFVSAIPYFRFLGITAETASGELLGKLTYAGSLIGNPTIPALHGGAIGGLLESTAIMQALWVSKTTALPKIITITIEFLRSGRPVDTFAKGVFTKQGRSVVNVGVEAWQDDPSRPIARAHAIFLVEPMENAGA